MLKGTTLTVNTQTLATVKRKGYCTSTSMMTPPPLKVMTEEQSDAHVVGVIFAQHFSLKKGLELFGNKADIAVQKELTQLHKMDT